ncbi:MAG: hypothetical protein ABI599_15490 [Flavobacteriales bacterium]
MIKLLPTASALLLACCSYAQTEHVMLIPGWKVGDARTLHIVKNTNETVNDTVRINDTREADALVKVTKNTANAFTIEMPYKGEHLAKTVEMNLEYGEGDAFRQEVNLRYDVRKADGKPDLVNWEEARTFVKNRIDTMRAMSADTATANKARRGMLALLEKKDYVQWLFSDQIGWITNVYGRTMLPKDSLHAMEKNINPLTLHPLDSLTTKTTVVISSLDQAKQRMIVRSEVYYDTKSYVDMEKKEITATAGVGIKNEKDKAEAKRKATVLANSCTATAKNLTNTTMNTRTSWPSKVVSTTRINSKRTGKHTVLTETWTVDVKE